MIFGDETPRRRDFPISVKKMEWMSAAGKDVIQYLRDRKFVKTSYCRNPRCHRQLVWGDGTYNFDHKDNNPANNSQRNCYLVCRICHGKATKIEKRAIRGIFGEVEGYETIKGKVSYKKPKSTTTKRKVTKRAPKKVASKAKKSTSVKRARAKRSRK
jgi:hypothetical protein